MRPVNLPSTSAPKPVRQATPASQPKPEIPALGGLSLRETAGTSTPHSLANSIAAPVIPRFEMRTPPAPELPGMRDWANKMNQDPRPPQVVLDELDAAKTHFGKLIEDGKQALKADSAISGKQILPILQAENARTPGLNAVSCRSVKEMETALQEWSKPGAKGLEGHVRFHLGLDKDRHRIALDAYRHPEGGFTLIAVESTKYSHFAADELTPLIKKNPDLIRGAAIIPTRNLAHEEGCRIFALHHLSALHDERSQIKLLHRQIYSSGKGRSVPQLSDSKWKQKQGNIFVLQSALDAFGLLPGKFFKHMQVKRLSFGKKPSLLQEAEARNPRLKDQPLNKQRQTLRKRFENQVPGTAPENFSDRERNLSLDKKRVVYLNRAIAHYERLKAQPPPR